MSCSGALAVRRGLDEDALQEEGPDRLGVGDVVKDAVEDSLVTVQEGPPCASPTRWSRLVGVVAELPGEVGDEQT